MIEKTISFPVGTPSEEIFSIREKYSKAGYDWTYSKGKHEEFLLKVRKAENDLDQLELGLQKHDWFYQMSDDYGVYCRGSENEKKLLEKAIELGPDGLALYNKYQKKAFGGE